MSIEAPKAGHSSYESSKSQSSIRKAALDQKLIVASIEPTDQEKGSQGHPERSMDFQRSPAPSPPSQEERQQYMEETKSKSKPDC